MAASKLSVAKGNAAALALITGAAPAGRSSTVIDITSDQPRVLRHGAVSVEQLEKIYGGPVSVDETMEQKT